MIITCPHCQTKYQVTFEAIGSAGRKVQCAHCRRAWDQQPAQSSSAESPGEAEADADRLFDAMAEDALDELMEAEEKAVAQQPASAPKYPDSQPKASPRSPDPAEMQRRQAAFSRRQNAMISRLPLARLRRTARILGVVALTGIVVGGYLGREQIVERYPDLAGVYESVGLGVNVIGLDFDGLETLKTLSGGNDVLMVSAQIVGLNPEPRPVPPIVVSLLDAAGHPVYEWSVAPQVRDLMAGERATFDTRLSLPPSEAVHVRLSFAGSNMRSELQGTEPAGAETALPAPSEPVDQHHAAPADTVHASQTITKGTATLARILLAEDDPSVRAFVLSALTMKGHEVVAEEDGGLAAETADAEGGRFDLLLSDIKMPVMDGIALALHVGAQYPDITIVLMTGFADQRERAHGLDALIYDVITKPFTLADLLAKVDDALAGKPVEVVSLARRTDNSI